MRTSRITKADRERQKKKNRNKMPSSKEITGLKTGKIDRGLKASSKETKYFRNKITRVSQAYCRYCNHISKYTEWQPEYSCQGCNKVLFGKKK